MPVEEVPKSTSSPVTLSNEHLWSKLPSSTAAPSDDYVSSRPLPAVAFSKDCPTLVANHQNTVQHENSNDIDYLKQTPPSSSSLGEETLMALLDIGIRSSIVSRPTRVAAGVKCLNDTTVTRLSNICPSSFTQRYTQRFREQSSLLPTISKWLGTFSARSAPISPDRERNHVQGRSLAFENDLWMTVVNGVRDPEGARRLHPLWSSKKSNISRRVPETVKTTLVEDILMKEGCFTDKAPDADLFGLALDVNTQADYCARHMPTVTSQCINDFGSARLSKDSDVDNNGQRSVDITALSQEPDNSAGSPPQLPGCAGRLSQTSDVSMIMAMDEPIEGGCSIEPADIIGGRTWLTQNVIRMHPLRQHEPEPNLGDQVDDRRKKHDFPLDLEAGWSGGALNGLLLEEESDNAGFCTNGSPSRSDTSLLDLREPHLLQTSRGIAQNPGREDFLEDWPAFMSSNLHESPSNTSLADVLGTDHLLWHMWKRRASVAPRGEEDMLEMKIMYERDPDMKLFGSGWELDPSDISSSSNEDPMLQPLADNRSLPRERLTTPTSPTSDRRSYVIPTRSSSSSSYVGQSDSSPKPQRRGSIMKRFSWGGRQHSSDIAKLDVTNLGGRTMEVKKRKTLDDYEMMDRETLNDDSNDMLF
ncbi:hypothetical protein LTR10_015231 [Elasticomyces elasticus]|uniref:Uncharacterized protein n=1 Tax=Exophiala sideris TaxID=1016849 RepID=A0ABR0JE91_9EURO|nr:hypothetical protein LTR10_015231 [Elasticomyces elasticus]KAK5032706.1 hypothetical protein LTS07_004116 [Exophiala sideris]KAK5037114.1 hypothetical protein LTR13_004919 [Exophiala sideris]KAK5062230.1 hypothetical protein LTR69_004588 [Exophiala sideris]KAK5182272.1 hypothetical protein LTR44_005283 [Eurotiomycetes sp. CCFEE 6388]